MKKKSPDKKPFLLNIEPELLAAVRARAEELDQNIGQYFCALARADVEKGGVFPLVPKSGPYQLSNDQGLQAAESVNPAPRSSKPSTGPPKKSGTGG